MPRTSTNTSKPNSALENALATIPKNFRNRMTKAYEEVRHRFQRADDKGLGIEAGHFAEIVLRYLQFITAGSFTPFGSHIQNFAGECRKIIESKIITVPESLRIVVPRALVFIYTVRNKRGIGHAAGDIEANRIDVATISRTCDWVMCELIRVHHNLPIEEAQDLIDNLANKSLPQIWAIGNKKRVLRKDLDFKQMVLLLCYDEPTQGVLAEDLYDWVEYSNYSVFKREVLFALHKKGLVEFDRTSEIVTISPTGIDAVEKNILN